MRTRSVPVALFAALLLTAPDAVRVQSPPESRYITLLDRYAAGEYSAAMALPALPEEEFQAARTALLSGEPAGRTAVLLRVAIVAHTEAAIAMRPSSTPLDARKQLVFAQRYAERLQSRLRSDPVAVRWWLLAIGYLHAQRNFRETFPVIERARALNGDTPELLLALGISHELGWGVLHVRIPGGSNSATLEDAEKAYTSVLEKDGGLLEARVRLARVRTLRGDLDGALRALREVRSGDTPLVYLSRLFEGDALERQGAVEEAQRRYEAAVALIPRAQSARIALAHVRHMTGARQEAAEVIRNAAADQTAAEEADPWFWYGVGYAVRIDRDLEYLRKLVRR